MWFRRSRRASDATGPATPGVFPAEWRPKLTYRWPTIGTLGTTEREHLEHLTLTFLGRFRFEAAQGFEITDEMKVLVAAQASLLLLELDDPTLDLYSRLTSVILHPRTVVLRGSHRVGNHLQSDGAQTLAGQAHHRGPVVLAWSTVAFEARHPDRGHNVVMHEFAHQLDMIDGTIDGTPPIDDAATRERWVEVCTRAYRAVRRGDESVLRGYAATDPGEFFAVATETFFTRPAALRDSDPELYDVLRSFYRQDPAGRSSATLPRGG